ncbi:MAG: penicillin acylase family protein, partial [Bacteroidota bacterium]
MRKPIHLLLFCYCFLSCPLSAVFGQSAKKTSVKEQTLQVKGLQQAVEIITDQWGIPHIYAQNEADLFFAQGYYAAKDRLFQFEVWRRQATGTVAELLGPRELKRDIGTRLFKFRGDMTQEMNHYHPRGVLIITSFVNGVNAYIDHVNANPELLPESFRLLQTRPQHWTPAVVISRHQGLLGNITQELNTGRQVALMGVEKTKALNWFHPNDPVLELDTAINGKLLTKDILELYNAYRRPVRFQPEDIIADARNDADAYQRIAENLTTHLREIKNDADFSIGSNNWVVSGKHTESGYPMMANDPHRTQAVPSLRYMAHLVAPGWNVIGGGEPEIPGISIGHNEHGAWGLTVFRTDAEDLYVYKINPDNSNQYWHKGAWEEMRIIEESIPVKGQKPKLVKLKYTRHGPVVFEDEMNKVAYAVRCGWAEVGGSPYLASLRMNQSKTFEEFREACNYSNIPGENMVWADRAGNIGWQAVGIAPIRRGFSGLVPIPGDGRYEWDGYLPIKAKPWVYNPASGIFSTANQNVTPNDYEHPDALGYSWADPYRGMRVEEVLRSGRIHSLMDMAALQTDYLSIPARTLVPLLSHTKPTDAD